MNHSRGITTFIDVHSIISIVLFFEKLWLEFFSTNTIYRFLHVHRKTDISVANNNIATIIGLLVLVSKE